MITNNYQDRTPQILAEVNKTIKKLTLKLQVKVKNNLNFVVLKVRTGRLRRSINVRFEETDGFVSGFVGTNVPYAKPHEYGFRGEVQVKEHIRMAKQVFGNMLPAPIRIVVKQHPRMMNLPEKSFMRSALAELQPEISGEINDAIRRGLNGS